MIIRIALLLAAGLMLGSCCLSEIAMRRSQAWPPRLASPCLLPPCPVFQRLAFNVCARRLAAVSDDEPQADDLPANQENRPAPKRFRIDGRGVLGVPISAGDSYEEQMAADKADEARLKRKLIICQNCSFFGQLRRPSHPVRPAGKSN